MISNRRQMWLEEVERKEYIAAKLYDAMMEERAAAVERN